MTEVNHPWWRRTRAAGSKKKGPGTRPRRAGVALEPLEGRLMLSASGVGQDAPAVVVNASPAVAPAVTSFLITVTGNGNTIADGDNTPSAADFTDFGSDSTAHLNGNVTRTYTIVNNGANTLTLTGSPAVTISGATAGNFTVSTLPTTSIAPGGSTTFTISFAPTIVGQQSAEVVIESNDPAHNPFTFSIQGTGLATTDAANGLQVATTHAGTGAGAINGQFLNVLYTGTLLNGTVFDASSLHGGTPFTFSLGQGQVIAGWDQGLLGMEVGESRTLIIPSALGYSTTGSGSVPANATLIFQVTLVSITGPTVTVSGQSHALTSGDTTPSTLDGTAFNTVPVGQTVTHFFTINSSGPGGVLSLPGATPVTVSGPNADQFTVTQPVVNAGQSGLVFTVSYTPTTVEAAAATITVATNDPVTPLFTFAVGLAAPDLTGVFAPTLVVPPALAAGDKLTVPVVVTDASTVAASGTVNITVQASPNGVWNDANATLGSLMGVTVHLAGNGSTTLTVMATIPAAGTLPVGTYDLLAMITPVTLVDGNVGNNVVSLKGGAVVPLNITLAGPDLAVGVGASSPGEVVYVPGDKLKTPIAVTNDGTRPAVGTAANPIEVDVRLSPDGTYNAGQPLLAKLFITSTIAPGASVNLAAAFQLTSAEAGPGNYFIAADVDVTNVVPELNEANNTGVSASAIDVAWEFGKIPGRSGLTALTVADADGTPVTFKLAGAGLGQVTGGEEGAGLQVTVTGTTLASKLTVTTKKSATPGDDGLAELGSITVGTPGNLADQTSLGAITAGTSNLAGDITVTGELASLTLGNVTAAGTLTAGAPATPGGSMKIILGNVDGLSINSGTRIASLAAKEWLQDGETPNTITAPSLGTLTVKGDFQAGLALSGAGVAATASVLTTASIGGAVGASTWSVAGKVGTVKITGNATLNLTVTPLEGTPATQRSLTSATIGGTLSGADWYVDGKAGKLTFGGLVDTGIYAGVTHSVTGLPATGDFDDHNGSIDSLTVKGPAAAFTGSDIAAWTLTAVSIAGMNTANAGTPFGVAGDSIKSLTITPPVPARKFTNLLGPEGDQSPLGGDFVLRLV